MILCNGHVHGPMLCFLESGRSMGIWDIRFSIEISECRNVGMSNVGIDGTCRVPYRYGVRGTVCVCLAKAAKA